MRKSVIAVFAVVLTFASFTVFAAGTSTAPAKPAPAATAAPAAQSLSGSVASVDETGKTFVVKTKDGKDVSVTWTDTTKVTGGKLAAGESVTVKWMEKDGKNVASSVSIHKASTHKAASHKK